MAQIKVDMTNVEDGFPLLPEGDYICKVAKITVEDGEKAKYLKWELVVGLGQFKGQKIWNNTSLAPQALFRLRDTIQACGVDVPKSVMSIDTDKFVGKIVGITVAHGTYKGKAKAEVGDLWRVVKTEKGYGRAAGAASAAVANPKPAKNEDPDDIADLPWSEDATGGIADDVEEIDV